jgi:hypothetical protein
MVVRHDEDDVRATGGGGRRGKAEQENGDAEAEGNPQNARVDS